MDEAQTAPKAPRGPNPENAARLSHIMARTKSEPGVRSPTIAGELGITTLQCSQLADRLVKKGEIQVVKVEGGVRTYYPAGYDITEAQKAAAEAIEAAKAAKKPRAKKSEAAAPVETETPEPEGDEDENDDLEEEDDEEDDEEGEDDED